MTRAVYVASALCACVIIVLVVVNWKKSETGQGRVDSAVPKEDGDRVMERNAMTQRERPRPAASAEMGMKKSLREDIGERIAVARSNYPDVFEEFRDLMKECHATCRSRDWLGHILSFTRKWPESKLKYGPSAWVHVEGAPPALLPQPVGEYADEEVSEGKARNGAARLSILDRFLNEFKTSPLCEQELLLDLVGALFGSERSPHREDEPLCDDLIAEVLEDVACPLQVRVRAALLLPSMSELRETGLRVAERVMEDAGVCDEEGDQEAVRRAALFLEIYGGPETLASLRRVREQKGWKMELVDLCIRNLERKLKG